MAQVQMGDAADSIGSLQDTGPHVTLIRPPLVAGPGQWSTLHTPPIGIAYLAGMLLEHKIRVAVIDGMSERIGEFVERDGYAISGMTVPEILDRIDPSTDLIGISCMFTQDWPCVRELVRAVGQRFPNALLIAGGEHISALPEYCLRACPELDFCVMGEVKNLSSRSPSTPERGTSCWNFWESRT